MTTSADIIRRAAIAIGYLGRTETLSAGDMNDGLTAFNSMLDSWSNEKLMSFVVLQRSFTLTINTQQYTIGSGGTINTTRPYDIVQAFVRDSSNNDYPMSIVPRYNWNQIGQKNITSQIPDTLFYDPQYPLGVINIFPIPLVAYTVFFDSVQNQVTYSDLVTSLSVPPGYERAYVMNLALELMNVGFPNMLGPVEYARLVEAASVSKANVKRANTKEVKAEYDAAVVSRSYATYNIYSDSYPRN